MIYTGNVTAQNRGKSGKKEHPVELPQDVQYSWRMVRDCLGINACGAFVTISLRFVCKIYSLSNPTGNQGCQVSNPMPYTIKIKCPKGHLIFMADGEGFEPPDELPHQRFSRPSHSTALPTILITVRIIYYFFHNANANF